MNVCCILYMCQAYPMNKKRRGKALIINVNKVNGQDERDGTDIDRDNLKHLWTELSFDVVVYDDEHGLTAQVF